ncbi:MAG: amidohydrolase family protein [Steroidobacteraceae bacterium]
MHIWATAFLAIAASLLTACGQRVPDGSVLIRASRLYAAPGQEPIDDAAVLMQGGKILAAGARKEVAARGAGRLEACDDGVLVAGFQNSHVHFTEPKWQGAAGQPAAELAASLEAMLTRFGFTTVVDTASELDNTVALRARIDKGEVAGPRILTAGGALYPKDGIPIYLSSLPPELLAELSQPETIGEALAAVQANLDGGADATKLFLMTPQGGGRHAFMEPDIALAASDETHRRDRPVLAHPTDIEGIEIAIEADVDVLVHTTIGEGKTVWEPALVQQLVSQKMAVIPTLMLFPYELKRMNLPAAVVEAATGDAIEQLRVFSAAGGEVLFGTDVGYMADYDPTAEYRLMAKALAPMQILASLTTTPAARWKEEARRGRVAAGMDADLVVLEADPAADVANFAKVRCTIRGGRPIHAAARD